MRNLDETFEGWAYRNGLSRHLSSLEKQRLLERSGRAKRVCRLTERGRLRALAGRDPKAGWSRRWDGWWRIVCFDVPTTENRQRRRLRHYLRNNGFGLLQRSLWVTPDPIDETVKLLKANSPDLKSLIFFKAQSCGGESNQDIVSTAWDFDRINRLYQRHLQVLDQRPHGKAAAARALLNWSELERLAWKQAVTADPLLPTALLPRNYLGRRAWLRRIQTLKQAAKEADCLKPILIGDK